MSDILQLQRLYDSEINFSLSTYWDGGFDWMLGLECEKKAEGNSKTMSEAVQNLVAAALLYYPNSTFAKGCQRGDGDG